MTDTPQGSPADLASESGSGFDLARLVEDHQAGIWRYLRALGCERELAADITQDTFVAVLEKPFDDYDPKATAGYLRTVARNLFISAMRRAGRMVVVEDIEAVDTTWMRWMGEDNGDELLDHLRDCLQQLTERARSGARNAISRSTAACGDRREPGHHRTRGQEPNATG